MSSRFLARALSVFGLLAGSAVAADSAVLIQLQPGGAYRVWHNEGATRLSEDEILQLDAEATAEGSVPIATSAGPASAKRTDAGVVISVPGAAADRTLLVDRDACSAIRTWHVEGPTRLSDDQLTELVLAAVPGGGPRVRLDGGRYAKSFLTPLGVMAAIWMPGKASR